MMTQAPSDVLIIGGGISGLVTAYRLEQLARARRMHLNVQLIEASPRLGGNVDTRYHDGFIIEGGVNGWLHSRTQVGELVRELRIENKRLPAHPMAKRRYIYTPNGLCVAPLSPVGFLKTPLLSAAGKGRVFLEPLAPAAPGHMHDTDESVADFVRRRLGGEMLDALVDPMVSGVFAGDPKQLSVRSAFPKLVATEATYGGLFAGLLAQSLRSMTRARGALGGNKLISLVGGMGTLIEALVGALAMTPRTGCPVVSLRRHKQYMVAHLRDGQTIAARQVVMAVPAYVAATLFHEADVALGCALGKIPYAPVAVVAMGYRQTDLRALDGFGFLVPGKEGKPVLGCLWDSTVYRDRAPKGHVLLRWMVGGVRHPHMIDATDEALLRICRDMLVKTRGLTGRPVFEEVIRHRRAIPQYIVGHDRTLGAIDDAIKGGPFRGRLWMTGNSYRGVSIGDCVGDAQRVAERVLACL